MAQSVSFAVRLLMIILCPLITGSAAQSIEFTEDTYTLSVEETYLDSYPPGVSVYPDAGNPRPTGSIVEVGCLDSITGGPVDVSYSIVEASNGSIHEDPGPGPFMVDPVSGGIFVTADLDYEVRNFYTFHVRCILNAQTSLTDTATVVVNILPINEFAPEANPNVFNIFGVDESLAVGTVLVSPAGGMALHTYTLTDLDQGGDEVLKFELDVEPDDITPNTQHISLDPDTGLLSVTGRLDVDSIHFNGSTDIIRVSIALCDIQPRSELCPNVKVKIFLDAANDNLPVFEQDMYEETVPEDLPVNSILDLGIVCTDNDRGTGSLQGIELSNQSLSMWAVDSEGIVTLREPLDFETSQRHEFIIKCLDTGGEEDEATIVINVGPVNDNPPHFDKERYHFDVKRSETPDYTIGEVRAFDNDGDIVTYSVQPANDNFEVDTITGEIKMVDYILASEGSSFTLTVIASDGELTANSTVTINVSGSLSVVGIAAVMTSLVVVIIVLITAVGPVCCWAVCIIPSRRSHDPSKGGFEMNECAAYNTKPQNDKVNDEPARTNRDSAVYERIPGLHARILPQTSATSLNSTYEPIPEDAMPWQYYYRPTQPHHHYDYVRERPQLKLPPVQGLECHGGRGSGGEETSRSDGGEEGRNGEHKNGGETSESDGGVAERREEAQDGEETREAGGREGSEEVQNKEEDRESERNRNGQGVTQTDERYINFMTSSTTVELSS